LCISYLIILLLYNKTFQILYLCSCHPRSLSGQYLLRVSGPRCRERCFHYYVSLGMRKITAASLSFSNHFSCTLH
jgi:hypothetical protein